MAVRQRSSRIAGLAVERIGAGPPILFLHGFPEGGHAWRAVASRLADAHEGVLPDLRGYGASRRPPEVEAYGVDALLGDIDALVEAVAPGGATIAAHDWGGVLAWWYAARRPDRVRRLVIANAPHPLLFQQALLGDPAQRAASDYIARLRTPGVAEAMFADAEALLDRMAGGATPDVRQALLARWRSPGAPAAMAAWYKAAPFALDGEMPGWTATERLRIDVPTLVLWGMQDTALLPVLLDGLPALVRDLDVVRIADAGHGVIHQQPDRVAAEIRRFAA